MSTLFRNKRLVYSLATLAIVLMVAGAAYFRPTYVEPAQGPLIQQVGPDALTVVWWDRPGREATLRLRGPSQFDTSFPAQAEGDRYEARAEGLLPGIAYAYEILGTRPGAADGTRHRGTVRTAGAKGSAVNLLVFGDSGSTGWGTRQYAMAELMSSYPADMVLHAGDLIYDNGEREHYSHQFFRPYRHLLDSVPFYPVLGNHDVKTENGAPFLEVFSMPRNGPEGVAPERCFYVDHADVRVIGFDSTLPPAVIEKKVAPWLERVLKESDARWKIVYFHHPLQPTAAYPVVPPYAGRITSILEAPHGADIVFTGHAHLYRRTHPLQGGKVVTEGGTVYVVSGAGGKSLYATRRPFPPWVASAHDEMFSFTWLQITADRLELAQIGEDGTVLDRAVLVNAQGSGKE